MIEKFAGGSITVSRLSMKLSKQEATVSGQEGETDEQQCDDSNTERWLCACARERKQKKKANLKTQKRKAAKRILYCWWLCINIVVSKYQLFLEFLCNRFKLLLSVIFCVFMPSLHQLLPISYSISIICNYFQNTWVFLVMLFVCDLE